MELLAAECRLPGDECDNAFVTGVFSLLDTMLGMPMDRALDSIALPESVIAALLLQRGPLAPLLELCIACETGMTPPSPAPRRCCNWTISRSTGRICRRWHGRKRWQPDPSVCIPQALHRPVRHCPDPRLLPCISLSTTPAPMSISKARAWCPTVPRCVKGPRLCCCTAWNLAQWGDDVRGVCDALGIAKLIVYCVSSGGFVAQSYATRHSERRPRPDHAYRLPRNHRCPPAAGAHPVRAVQRLRAWHRQRGAAAAFRGAAGFHAVLKTALHPCFSQIPHTWRPLPRHLGAAQQHHEMGASACS